MNETGRDLVLRMVREEMERLKREPPPPAPSPPAPLITIPHTELKERPLRYAADAGWNVYVREVGRLIAEGNEGKWVVIAESRILGVYDTIRAAHRVIGEGNFTWPTTVKQILSREPLLYAPIGRYRPCPNCRLVLDGPAGLFTLEF